MALPIRAQLSTLVFEKSLRRKNVKSTEKSKESSEEDDTKNKDDDSVLKSRQSIVNLYGIYAQRVSNFSAYQFLIINSVAKLVIFSTFLVQIIGWIPFTAGLFTWAITLPANTWFSKALMARSEQLMKQRDEKLAVVNEALLG